MRKIKTADVYKLARFIRDCGLEREFKAIYDEAQGKDAQTVGVDATFRVLGSLTTEEAEMGFYGIFGDIVGKTAEEVADTDLDQMMDEIEQLAKENDLKRFFDAAAKLIR